LKVIFQKQTGNKSQPSQMKHYMSYIGAFSDDRVYIHEQYEEMGFCKNIPASHHPEDLIPNQRDG
jgi:hypothetical protein